MTPTDRPEISGDRNPAVPGYAPWHGLPDIVTEVTELEYRFSVPELCVAEVLCDVHPAESTAFNIVDGDLNVCRLSYGELADQSKRLASALRDRGVGRGSRVGVLMGKSRQLPIVLLALWRLGAVHVPLFTAFAGPAVAVRLDGAQAKLVIVDPDQLDKVDGVGVSVLESGDGLDAVIDSSAPVESNETLRRDELFIQLYTSGTTGTPKGVGVPAFAIAAFVAYMRYGLDLSADDVLWNAADPGWAYGLYFGIVGPLAMGRPNILLTTGFSAELTKRVIDELKVTNFAAAPTVYRALKKGGAQLRHPLRAASSAGESLTPDITSWAPAALGVEVRDHWGQTEQGMAIVNPWDPRLRREVEAGSMGSVLPGFVAGTIGASIALSVDRSPLMWFTGYVRAPEQTEARFTEGGKWYLTGDIGHQQDGNFYFSSRDDDVILAAGYRIAPFDIEIILTADQAVAEAAVVGRPDSIRGEVVEAFVVLNPSASDDGLEDRLRAAVRNQYGAHAYPRRIHVVEALPKTPSGKVQRFMLRGLSDQDIHAFTVGK